MRELCKGIGEGGRKLNETINGSDIQTSWKLADFSRDKKRSWNVDYDVIFRGNKLMLKSMLNYVVCKRQMDTIPEVILAGGKLVVQLCKLIGKAGPAASNATPPWDPSKLEEYLLDEDISKSPCTPADDADSDSDSDIVIDWSGVDLESDYEPVPRAAKKRKV